MLAVKQLSPHFFNAVQVTIRAAGVIVHIITTITLTKYCWRQLVLSMIVHAMKRQSRILNEDTQAVLLCGGKDRHHWGHYGVVNYVYAAPASPSSASHLG